MNKIESFCLIADLITRNDPKKLHPANTLKDKHIKNNIIIY